MDERTWTCIKFQMEELPCTHAMGAIKKGHLDAYEYYSIYYKKQTYLDTYEDTVNSVGNLNEWEILGQVEQIEVEAPIIKCIAGRPKKLDSYHVGNSGSVT